MAQSQHRLVCSISTYSASRYGVCCNGHGGNGFLSAKSTAYESVGENSSGSLCSIIVNESFGELLREVEKEAEKNKLAWREDHHGVIRFKLGVWELAPFFLSKSLKNPRFS